MKVSDLIKELKKLPQDKEVVLGGVEDDTHPIVQSVLLEWSDVRQKSVVLILPHKF